MEASYEPPVSLKEDKPAAIQMTTENNLDDNKNRDSLKAAPDSVSFGGSQMDNRHEETN